MTLVVTMCMCTSVEVFAARAYLYQKDGTQISFAQNAEKTPLTVTEVDGVYGRAKGDISGYYFRKPNDGQTLSNSYFATNLTLDTSKDLIIETSFVPKDNVKSIALGTNGNARFGFTDIGMGDFNADQWNKYKAIINLSTNEANVYINGKHYGKYTYTGLVNKIFRFIFNSTDTTSKSPIGVYMDYFHVYHETIGVETGAETMPFTSTTGTGYTADLTANTITFDSAYTVSSLKSKMGIADSVAMRVYADNSYEAVLTDTSKIYDGNVIVLQTATDLFQYITVDVNDGMEPVFVNNGDSTNIATPPAYTIVEGLRGKDASDSVLNYSRTNANTYAKVEYNFDTSKVIIAQMQFMPDDKVTAFTLGNSGNAPINSAFNYIRSSEFNLNEWNNVKVIIDLTNNKASMYINDKKYESSGTVTFKPADRLRFIVASSASIGVYYDNIKAYETTKSFAEVDYGFDYPVTASTSEYTYDATDKTIDFGSYVTLAQAKAKLNVVDCDVRAYTADFASKLGENDTMTGGCLLVLEKLSGEIQTLEIKSREPKDAPTVLYYNDGSKLAYGTTASVVTGAKGRLSTDSSIKVGKSATTGLIWYGTPVKTLNIENRAKDLVYEYSFVPPEGMERLLLAHSSSHDIGVGFIPAEEFVPDAWNKIKLVWNLTTNKGEVFINGKPYVNDVSMMSALPTELRSVFYMDGKTETPYMYMDEFKVYLNDIGFESDEVPYYIEDGDDYIINADNMTFIGEEVTVSAFKNAFADEDTTIRAYSANYAALLDDNATLSTGDRIVIVAPNNIITTYTFEEIVDNKLYLSGEGLYSDTQYTAKPIDIKTRTNGPATLVIGRYNENNMLVSLNPINIADAGWFDYTYTPADVKGTIRFMILDSITSAKPLAEKVELDYLQSLSVLIVGNSFSTDSLKYLREIAAADGVNIDVGRLIKGGSDFKHHYDSRETTEEVNTLHYNGIATGYTNLKTVLEEYDWDYVAVQNWSSSNPETLSEDFWSPVGEDLIAYIHEHEPNAEILINKVWSYEMGYSYVKDNAVRNRADAALTAKTQLVADNAADRIGVDKIRIVPAGDAFTYARNYKDLNGVHIFDTTYYAEGHSFTSDMNRQTISVGQGILTEEEEEAGFIRLHRDGFHSSLIARYMLASVWYEALTGNNVVGNTFVPESDAIDSGAIVMDEAGSLVVYYKFDTPPQDRIELVQKLVHTMMQNYPEWK